MGIFIHRRAERANCIPQQTECSPVQPETCLPEDPRQQFVEIRNNKIETLTGKSKLPGQTELPPPAPAVDAPETRPNKTTPAKGGAEAGSGTDQTPVPTRDALPPLPALVITDRTPSSPARRGPADVPPPPLPDPELAGSKPRDLYQYSDGKTDRTNREVPPPPLPDPELAGSKPRDLYQYSDGKTIRPVPGANKDTDLPQMPLDVPQPSDLSSRPLQKRESDDLQRPELIDSKEEFHDHPGPGSLRRRSLRAQLNLPERHSPDPGRPPINDTPSPGRVPIQRPNDQNFAPPAGTRVPQDRLTPDMEDVHTRKHNRLEARLERLKEKIARLTHFSSHEREVAFSPNAAEQRTLELINNERRRHRLPDLVHDPRLQMIANRHTDYQVRHGMTHNENTPGWQNVSQRMKQVGLEGWRENAGSGAFTPESLVQMWMNSPGHRAAILGTGNIGAVCIRNGKATFNLTTDPELQRGA